LGSAMDSPYAIEEFHFVDGHVHLWDMRSNRWYGDHGKRPGLPDVFLPETYAAQAQGYRVDKVVHVTVAATPQGCLKEINWLEGLAESRPGWPSAIVGGATVTDSLAQIEADLDAQAASPLFRGARIVGLSPTDPKTPDILRLAAERDWVIDLLTDPHDVATWLPILEKASDTKIVIEHTGRPLEVDPTYVALWRSGMQELAQLNNLSCKISRMPMTILSVDAQALRPWVETCLELFGIDRCFFATNFPFDRMYGDFGSLMASYRTITQEFDAAAVRRLFVSNAEQVYAI
jgi:L-fuconolactonase